MANPEQALWRAVIYQAIEDASGKSRCSELDRARAYNWLFKSNHDFNNACALADLEPDQVRAKARQVIGDAVPKQPRKKLYEFNGRTQNIRAWAEELGCPYWKLYSRLVTHNWSPERAFTTPLRENA